jgi:nucleotide-binding universal stress UspA family protein
MVKRILIPTDFSDLSDAALDYARNLAAALGASLHVLHVFDTPEIASGIGADTWRAGVLAGEEWRFIEAQDRLRHRVRPEDRTRHAARAVIVSSSQVARTIADYAASRRIDLIVMGTHGRSGMAHLFMGSVAEKVVRTAPCPVTTVRHTAPADSLEGALQFSVDPS